MADRALQNQLLTSDNTHLSEVTFPPRRSQLSAVDCTPAQVSEYLEAGIAENSRLAYLGDLAHFRDWGGTIPCSPETVATYLAAHAQRLSSATLGRRLASISKAHQLQRLQSPAASQLVRSTLRGIRRKNGTAQRRARPLLRDELFLVLEGMPATLKATRDRALLLVGFAGALRRSELVELNVGDVEHVRKGVVLHLRRSKTDPEGAGQAIGIPFGRTKWCPVSWLDMWLKDAEIASGPVFRPIDRHGRVHRPALSPEAVARVIKARTAAVGLDAPSYSGHSLRAGFATSAAEIGLPSWQIRSQTRHASDAMLSRYIRLGDMFTCNAASALL